MLVSLRDSVIHFIFYTSISSQTPRRFIPPLTLSILDHVEEQEFVDVEDSTPSLPIRIHRTPPISVLAPYHSRIRQKTKGKAVEKEAEDLGPEVSSSQSVHRRSTPLPSLFARQNLGHAVSTTIPSSFAQSQESIASSDADDHGSRQYDHTPTKATSSTSLLVPLPTRPSRAMSQSGYDDLGLGSAQDSFPPRTSDQAPPLAQYHHEHSQPYPSSSHLPPHTPVTAVPSAARPPGVFTVPEAEMADSLSTTNTTARHPPRPVRIKPQGRFEMFNGKDVERFLRRWEIAGEIQEASDLDLVKQLPFFVGNEDIRREVEDMSGYVEQDWSSLRREMVARWGLLEPECKFTLGDLSDFCKKTWQSGGVAHREGYQRFRQTFDVMAAYLVKKKHVRTEDDLTELFYRAFCNTKRAELKKWLREKDLMFITDDQQYLLPALQVLKQVADQVVRADVVLSFENERAFQQPSYNQHPPANPLPPRPTPSYAPTSHISPYPTVPPRPPTTFPPTTGPRDVPPHQSSAFRTYREAPPSVSSQGDMQKKVNDLTNQISLLAARIPDQPNPAPVASHARSSSRDAPAFSCFYCQEGAHQPARCSLLQEDTRANLVTYEKGTGYVLPDGSRISHDPRRPVRAVVMAHSSSKGVRVTTVALTSDPPALGGSSMLARLQASSPSPPLRAASPPPIELSSVSAFPILAGNEIHINAITRSAGPTTRKSAFATKKKGKKPAKEPEEPSRIEELPDDPPIASSSTPVLGPEVRPSITTDTSAMEIDEETARPVISLPQPPLTLPSLPPPSSVTTRALPVKTDKKKSKMSSPASPSSTAVEPEDEDELDELELAETPSTKLPRAVRPRFERPVSVSHPDATDALVKKILALKLPDISVGEVVSVAPALAEALKFQFSRHRKTQPIELSINATSFGKGLGGLISEDEDDEERTFSPLFACPLGFLQCFLGATLVAARPLVDNGAQINVICVTLLARLGIVSWVDVRFTVKAFGGAACKIIGVVEDVKIKVGKIEGTITMFVSNSRQGDCLLGLPFLCDFGAVLEFSPVSQILVLKGSDARPVKFQLAREDSGSWYRSLLEWTRATRATAVLASVGVELPGPVVSDGFLCEDVRYVSEEGLGFRDEDFV